MQICVLSNPKPIFAVKNRFWLLRAIFISGGRSGSRKLLLQKLRNCIWPLTINVLNIKYARLNVNNAKVISCACEFYGQTACWHRTLLNNVKWMHLNYSLIEGDGLESVIRVVGFVLLWSDSVYHNSFSRCMARKARTLHKHSYFRRKSTLWLLIQNRHIQL